eukprot:scaffold148099_cov30-Tisochrysis_lutea.AAC.1
MGVIGGRRSIIHVNLDLRWPSDECGIQTKVRELHDAVGILGLNAYRARVLRFDAVLDSEKKLVLRAKPELDHRLLLSLPHPRTLCAKGRQSDGLERHPSGAALKRK